MQTGGRVTQGVVTESWGEGCFDMVKFVGLGSLAQPTMLTMKNMKSALLPLLVLLLVGCTTTPPSRFYVLTPQATSLVDAKDFDLVVGVGPVRLVAYLERPQIVAREGDHLLKLEEFDRWGGTLETNITWVMADNLSRGLGTDAVVTYPWERAVVPDYQVSIDIRRFDLTADGEVHLSAQWRILGDDGRELFAIEKTELSEPMSGSGFAAQVAAQSRVLANLSDTIAAKIAQLRLSR